MGERRIYISILRSIKPLLETDGSIAQCNQWLLQHYITLIGPYCPPTPDFPTPHTTAIVGGGVL